MSFVNDRNGRLPLLLAGGLVYAVCVLWAPQRWLLSAFQIAAFAAAIATLLRAIQSRQSLPLTAPVMITAAAFAWGVTQLATGSTSVKALTLDAVLYWLTASAVVLLTAIHTRQEGALLTFLKALLYSGFAISVVGTLQSLTSEGKVLWLFPTAYDSHVIGPFVYHNNYAAFIELLTPIALWLALDPRERPWLHLAIGAWMIASVLASGSRTGTVLVVVEALVVFAIALWRTRSVRENLRFVLPFAAIVVIASVVCGHELVISRFQQSQPYAVRYSFLLSSIEMFKSNPITGFGLGTWPFAYKQFALIDTGSFANHAHSEWAQWAAEGGAPMLFLMVGLAFWTFRAAVASVWGIGILSVFAHSAVDYPFVRLGLAVWIFALLGALAAYSSRYRWRANLPVAVAGIAVLVLGGFLSARDAYADSLFATGTVSSIVRALQVNPERTDYHRRLAALDSKNSVEHLRNGLAVNAFDTRSRIALAMELEAAGRMQEAESELQKAVRLDKQYAPAWALANFYYRAGAEDSFWMWARRAAEMAPDNLSGLFDLSFRISDDPEVVYRRVVDNTRLKSRFVSFLVDSGRSEALAELSDVIVQPLEQEPLLRATDALLTSGDHDRAHLVWSKLLGRASVVTNADFSAEITGRGFDWQLHPHSGIQASPSEGLSFTLTGEQPEQWDLITQPLALPPGSRYTVHIRYRTFDLPSLTGLSCQVGSNEEISLPATEQWKDLSMQGTINPGGILAIRYTRPRGATRAQGRLELRKVDITLHTADAHV